jgi:Porphobilinogen deaminase, C-terminal domain
MGIWIELSIFGLVFLFAWHQFHDLKKEKEKRMMKRQPEPEPEPAPSQSTSLLTSAAPRALNDPLTELTTSAERAVVLAMGGPCAMPLAARAHCQGRQLHLHAVWGDPLRPGPWVQATASKVLSSDHQEALHQAVVLGEFVAEQLQAQGALCATPRLE